jgi:Tfp pilus assembly protein PilF
MKQTHCLGLCLLCLILARIESKAQVDPEILRQQGLQQFRTGNFTGAAELFKQAIELDPGNSNAHNELGVTYVRLGRLEESVASFQTAIGISPGLVEARYNLGTQYFKLGKYGEAIHELTETVRLEPGHANAWNNLGVALARVSHHRDAINAYKSALQIRPASTETLMLLSISIFEVSPADAIAPLKEAVRLDPYGADALNSLGVVYSKIGKAREAAQSFRQALAVRPDYPAAMYNLGAMSLAYKNRDVAMEQYSRLKTLDRELADRLYRGIHQGMILTLTR